MVFAKSFENAKTDETAGQTKHPIDEHNVVLVRNLGKMYHLYDRPQDRLKQAFLWGRKRLYREFWALRDVSFEVKKGEVLGIIGRNGAGKSTLLQILTGTLSSTTGEVRIKGRLAALLELGSGFNPEYTGRENVFMNGAILGIPQAQMEKRFDEIAEFADIGEFIDQPVKTYSSGMFVRLAFAVQVCVYPDIFIVDEVLAVGDAAFQRKCYRRIGELRERGCTILFVSHSMNAVRNLCTRALLIEQGHLIMDGPPSEVSEQYQRLMFGEGTRSPVQEYGDGSAEFLDIWLDDLDGQRITSATMGSEFYFCFRLRFLRSVEEPVFGMRVKSIQGVVLSSTNTQMMGVKTGPYSKGDEVTVRSRLHLALTPGYYFFSCGCSYLDVDRFLCRRVDALKLTVLGPFRNSGYADLVHEIAIETG